MESLKFHLGTMKNMQGTLMNVGNEPYNETIFPSPDKRICAIEADKRHCLKRAMSLFSVVSNSTRTSLALNVVPRNFARALLNGPLRYLNANWCSRTWLDVQP